MDALSDTDTELLGSSEGAEMGSPRSVLSQAVSEAYSLDASELEAREVDELRHHEQDERNVRNHLRYLEAKYSLHQEALAIQWGYYDEPDKVRFDKNMQFCEKEN